MKSDGKVETRGRPTLPPEQRRSERVTCSFTPGEYAKLKKQAASAEGGPYTVKEYARLLLLNEGNTP